MFSEAKLPARNDSSSIVSRESIASSSNPEGDLDRKKEIKRIQEIRDQYLVRATEQIQTIFKFKAGFRRITSHPFHIFFRFITFRSNQEKDFGPIREKLQSFEASMKELMAALPNDKELNREDVLVALKKRLNTLQGISTSWTAAQKQELREVLGEYENILKGVMSTLQQRYEELVLQMDNEIIELKDKFSKDNRFLELKEKIQQLEDDKTLLERDLKEEIAQLSQDKKNLELRILELEGENQGLQSENEELSNDLKMSKENEEFLWKQLEAEKVRNARLEQELIFKNDNIAQLETEIARKAALLDKATAEREQLKQELDNLCFDLDNLKKENQILKAELKDHKKLVDQLEKDMLDANSTNHLILAEYGAKMDRLEAMWASQHPNN